MKYRKKPVVIEAWPIADLFNGLKRSWRDLPEAVSEAYRNGDVIFRDGGVDIHTAEGWMFGRKKDFLISGIQGELYPCKPDIFAATYELVE